MRLDIACGQAKRDGHVGIDIADLPGVDFKHDLLCFPWPIESESVDSAFSSHFFEHVPGKLRPAFMSEVWRILKPGAEIVIVTPLGLTRQCQDFTHEWPPIYPDSFHYFDRAWLRAIKHDHYVSQYNIHCNFKVVDLAVNMDENHQDIDDDRKRYAVKYLTNAASDLVTTLRKVPLDALQNQHTPT
jgi:predicted SAM-dependent methyltransferase